MNFNRYIRKNPDRTKISRYSKKLFKRLNLKKKRDANNKIVLVYNENIKQYII